MFRLALPCLAIVNCVLCSPYSLSPCELDAKSCITSLAQEVYAAYFEGSSELKIDPIFNKQIDATLPTLEFTLRNTTSKGFKKCYIKDASISSDITSVHIEMLCPRFEMCGHYEADGTIESVPFKGNGTFSLTATDYDLHLDLNIESTVRNEKKYIRITGLKVEADLKGGLDFKLENLFNGNEQLSAATHKFIKENPVFVARTVQKPVFDAYFKTMVEVVNKGIENTPVNKFIK